MDAPLSISEVIFRLEKIRAKHGELPCFSDYDHLSYPLENVEFRSKEEETLFYDDDQEPIDHVEIW